MFLLPLGFFIWMLFISLVPSILYDQVESHRRAAAAGASGKFKDEIVPVMTKVQKEASDRTVKIMQYDGYLGHIGFVLLF